MDIKICMAGKICSGKSTLARKIATHTGYRLVSFGGILNNHLVKSDLSVTRDTLQSLGQELINQLGYEGFLQWSIEHSPHIRWDSALVIDGLRHGAIYSRLVEIFPQTILIYCNCDPETQITRLMERDKVDRNKAEQIILHETEWYIAELESQANLFFWPGDSIEDFLAQLDVFIAKLR